MAKKLKKGKKLSGTKTLSHTVHGKGVV